MRILGLDFETTGLNHKTDRVIEVGAVLWDTKDNKPEALISELILPNDFAGLTSEIVAITGITDESLKNFGQALKPVFEKLLVFMKAAEYIVAHNANFDRQFFQDELTRLDLSDPFQRPWIDTLYDIPYPANITTRKLTYLAAEHRLFNPFSHRALFDSLTMMEVLAKYDIETVIERSKSPNIDVISLVSYNDREKAKKMGFHWAASEKKWIKTLKECDIANASFPFDIETRPTSPTTPAL